MRKIILTEWITLDGFTAGPDNDMSFVGESFNEEMARYEDAILSQADTILLGRVTYESFAGSWPFVPDKPDVSEEEKAYARKLNAARKVVFSRTLEWAEWNNSQLVRELDPAYVASLKEEEGRDILIYGSASIVQQLTQHGLIDEYQLLVHPLILGSGKPLFKDIKNKRKLSLASATPVSSGVLVLTYQR